MREITAIVNRKGGVGKTATAHALGVGLVKRGFRVLFIDLDSQCNLTFDLRCDSFRNGALEVLSGTAPIKEAMVETVSGAFLVPASPSLAGADKTLTDIGKEYRLKEAIEPIKDDFDYIIIDTPPALGILTVNALTVADSLIIPAQPEVHSLQGIGLLNETIEPIKRYCNQHLKVKGILITRYNGRTTLSKDMKSNLESIADTMHTKVFSCPVRECTAIKEAQAVRENIFDYAPKSNGTQDYNKMVDEYLF